MMMEHAEQTIQAVHDGMEDVTLEVLQSEKCEWEAMAPREQEQDGPWPFEGGSVEEESLSETEAQVAS